MQVHVSASKFRLYENASATAPALTLDGENTMLHACDQVSNLIHVTN
jgi:hypothetical protein